MQLLLCVLAVFVGFVTASSNQYLDGYSSTMFINWGVTSCPSGTDFVLQGRMAGKKTNDAARALGRTLALDAFVGQLPHYRAHYKDPLHC